MKDKRIKRKTTAKEQADEINQQNRKEIKKKRLEHFSSVSNFKYMSQFMVKSALEIMFVGIWCKNGGAVQRFFSATDDYSSFGDVIV